MSAEHPHCPGPDDAQSNGARVDSVSVSGFEMYYESWGVGRPLVLLHGAISTIEPSFGAVIPRVAQTRRLIAVEQQAHGRTADIERPLTYTQMAEDTATLVRKLRLTMRTSSVTAWEQVSRSSWQCSIRSSSDGLLLLPWLTATTASTPIPLRSLWKPSPVCRAPLRVTGQGAELWSRS